MKTCTKCKAEKQESEFSKDKKAKDGLSYHCKACVRARHIECAERISEQKREYRLKNKDAVAAMLRAWSSANLDKRSAYERNRNAMKRSSNGTHTAKDVKGIFESQRGLCATCEVKLFKSGKKKFHVDHIMPLAKGGRNDKYNLQCLCPECNLKKHAKDPADWARENGKLI
jgi:5-methylcytosine-specific restriction endonuclease McrA